MHFRGEEKKPWNGKTIWYFYGQERQAESKTNITIIGGR